MANREHYGRQDTYYMETSLAGLLLGLREHTTCHVVGNSNNTHLIISACSKSIGLPVAYMNITFIRKSEHDDAMKFKNYFRDILHPTEDELTMFEIETGEEFCLAPYYKQ